MNAPVGKLSASERDRKARDKKTQLRKQNLALKIKEVRYVSDAPRCSNCGYFQKPAIILQNSLPIKLAAKCKLHKFKVKPSGHCVTWAAITVVDKQTSI